MRIIVANGTQPHVSTVGNCVLPTPAQLLKLNYVFHVPHLKHNLISICHLCKDNNCQVVFD